MISQTVEYALRAMVHMAGLNSTEAANSESIATRTKVPQTYLSKVLRDLVVAGLIDSQRGPHGGFRLSRPADQITMLEVVNAVDPIQRIRKCPLGNPAHLNLCPLHQRLDDAIADIERTLGRTTLSEMLLTRITPNQCGRVGVDISHKNKPARKAS